MEHFGGIVGRVVGRDENSAVCDAVYYAAGDVADTSRVQLALTRKSMASKASRGSLSGYLVVGLG